MGSTIVIVLIFLAVAVGAYALAKVLSDVGDTGKRKIQQRLTSDTRAVANSDQPAVSLYLAEKPDEEVFGRVKFISNLRRKLAQVYPGVRVSSFLLLCVGVGVVGLVMGYLMTGAIVAGVVASLIGILPLIVLGSKCKRRHHTLGEQLPETLDFLSRVLRAGHSLGTGLQMAGTELPDPLAAEFRRAYDQHSVGVALEEALKEMSRRIDSTDFAFFVTATLIQRQTGGDLSQVLNNISGMIRQRLRLQQQVRAKTAEGRFTGYILSGFPVVMFFVSYVLNPKYAGELLKSGTGITLLCLAGGFTLLGLFAIKHLTTVRV